MHKKYNQKTINQLSVYNLIENSILIYEFVEGIQVFNYNNYISSKGQYKGVWVYNFFQLMYFKLCSDAKLVR